MNHICMLGRSLLDRKFYCSPKCRRYQSAIYNFLERPSGLIPILYHTTGFCTVFTNLALSVLTTIEEYENTSTQTLYHLEIIVVIWFTIEFAIRVWASGCRSRYQGWKGRLRFARRPFCILDFVTITASIVVLGMKSDGQVLAASTLRGLRFFQILRMVRMDRRGGTWKLLGSVVYAHRQELITTLYIGFLGLLFTSFLVYMAEKDVNKKFSNYAQALWWGVITLCTVGYGDMVPETWQGKLIASVCSLLGVSFFALPAGILGSGFALKVQQQQRQKHMNRRRQPAAMLIQSIWRCYAADEDSTSIATWKVHHIPLPSPTSSKQSSNSFKYTSSFVSRLQTIRRFKSPSRNSSNRTATPTDTATILEIGESDSNMVSSGSGGIGKFLTTPNIENVTGSIENIPMIKRHGITDYDNNENDDDLNNRVQLTTQHKNAIRAIRKMKFLVARRNFKETLKPYDVKDVIDQYAAGHLDLINKVKTIQNRYFVARKKFKEALKPYDVKDVIEQYSSGHTDLLNKVRNLQARFDQILGRQGSNAKDTYNSNVSLASRVVKVERQVDEVDSKVAQLLELYLEDRKQLLELYLMLKPELQQVATSTPNPNNNYIIAPKPILMSKSTPTILQNRDFNQTAIAEDVPLQTGGKVKKKVTLSSPYDDDFMLNAPTFPQDLDDNLLDYPPDIIVTVPEMGNDNFLLRPLQQDDLSPMEIQVDVHDDDDDELDEIIQVTETTNLLDPSTVTEIMITPAHGIEEKEQQENGQILHHPYLP